MVEVIYFTAKWCGPCRMVAPIIEQLKSEGHNITKVDSDEFPELAREYGVMGIPSFFVKKDGHLVKRHTGALNRDGLLSLITV